MNFNDWLDSERGRLVLVANHFKVTPSAVSQWKDDGVPAARMLAVSLLTGGVVSVEEMLRFLVERKSAPVGALEDGGTA